MPSRQWLQSNQQSAAPVSSNSEQTIVPRLLTVKQAAIYLSCAVWAIREAVWSKELRACKIGNKYVIPREELDRFVDRRVEERANSG